MRGARLTTSWFLLSLLSVGCTREETPPSSTFYERSIDPILQGSCSKSQSGSSCHVAADDKGNALGNLDVASYQTLALRHDLLKFYGPYGIPALLLKSVPPFELELSNWRGDSARITTDVPHAGGSVFDFSASAFTKLERWMTNGAAENNQPEPPPERELLPCSSVVGSDPLFDPDALPGAADYKFFADNVNRVLAKRCAAGNCHGSPTNSLYLTCGASEKEGRWNYFAAGDYSASKARSSELLRRALAPKAGGSFHEGGTVFESTTDPDYQILTDWVAAKGEPDNVPPGPGFAFFEGRVQPMLVKRGCMILGCHSSSMFHDYRLRGGSGGHFSLPATRTNYRLSLEQVALESQDPNTSRLIRKNLVPAPNGPGLTHRGGALFAGHVLEECDLEAAESGPLDEQQPYCVIARWIEKERAERMAARDPLTGIAYVRRSPAPLPDMPQDYGAYAPDAEVVLSAASLDAAGVVTLGAETSLSALCGLERSVTDARRPSVSWDGKRIAFAARTADAEPLQIYVVEGATCAVEPTIAAPAKNDDGDAVPTNGELVHNFDPAFAPDGRLVFVSTRGNLMNGGAFDYQGPQRTPADPARLNANLYVLENGKIRQLTFLLNQELTPAFMGDGRLIFVTEKRAPGFYQLAGRRQNLDGADYHPLFGQRSTIGYNQFTDVVELADKNFAAILSEKGAVHSAGTLAIVNRSIGVDQGSTNEEDYLQDPGAISYPNPKFYQRSLSVVDPRATGRLAETQGAYRNPSSFPDGRVLVSYAANVTSLENFDGHFELVLVDPASGAHTPLLSSPDELVWPAAVYARPPREVFRSRLDEPNGAAEIVGPPDRANLTFMDLSLSASLFFQNTRSARRLAEGPPSLEFWESMPPASGVTSFEDAGKFVTRDDYGQIYVRRRLLGAAEILEDGSSRVDVPGGLPLVLKAVTALSGEETPSAHFQREEVQFYPGEVGRQGFRRDFFDGVCAGCHGTVSGLESHFAANPDILTGASSVLARDARPTDLVSVERGAETGPDFP